MHINNLGGPKLSALSPAARPSPSAPTGFGALLQASAGAAAAGRGGLHGSSIVTAALSASQGSGFGGPYLQAAQSHAGAQPLSASQPEVAQALTEIMQLSLMSFINGTFALGQNQPQLERVDE